MAIALVAVSRCSFRRGTDVSPSLAAGLFLHPGQGRSRDPARHFVRGVKRPVGLHAIEDRGRASQGEFQRPFHKSPCTRSQPDWSMCHWGALPQP
jgi:hypothetical protein